MWLVVLAVTAWATHAQAWWANAVYYDLLLDSFKDNDGDGIGDLRGAAKQISYVKALGADAVILSPLSAASQDCTKPGIVDFTSIDQRYGDLDSFTSLIEKTRKMELKVVVRLPIQTVSTASDIFTSSVAKTPGFEDILLWEEGTENEPPSKDTTNWTWNETRGAHFASVESEAMLNFCSEAVSAALVNAQCAWLRRGASGVLINPDFPPDQKCGEQLARKLAGEAINCARMAVIDMPVILVETTLDPGDAMSYYANGGVGAHHVLSRALVAPDLHPAPELALSFHEALLNTPDDGTPAWMTSASNENRINSRVGGDMVDAVNLLAMVLPGAAIIRQGDELGAADTMMEWATSESCFPSKKAPASAPFPWDDSVHGGFTTGEPWLPLAPNYRYANAKTEFGNDHSHVGVLRVASALRRSPAMGPHSEIRRLEGAVAVLRWGAAGSLLVACNVAQQSTEVRLSKIPGLPQEMTIAACSAGSSLAVGTHLNLEKNLKLAPGEAVLLVGPPRHCGGPGPVDKITNKLSEGWQKLNKYFSNLK